MNPQKTFKKDLLKFLQKKGGSSVGIYDFVSNYSSKMSMMSYRKIIRDMHDTGLINCINDVFLVSHNLVDRENKLKLIIASLNDKGFEYLEDVKLKWPQKYWWIIMIATAILFPLLIELLKPMLIKETNQSQPSIQVKTDTVYKCDSFLKK